MDAQRQDEVFDVVDENDQVIGQASRGEVHDQNLRHRAVHVLIYNDKGELFLQKRSPHKDKFPGCWDSSCSGHVDTGEDYERAARRELAEELGFHPTLPLRPFLKLPACEATGQEFIQVYLLGPSDGPFHLNPQEITEGEFVSPHHIDLYLNQYPQFLAGAFRYLWANHRSQLLLGFVPGAAEAIDSAPPPAAAKGKGWFVGLGALGVLLSKWKLISLFFFKFGGTIVSMLFTLLVYTKLYGWKFAFGLVVLLFFNRLGNVIAAKLCGYPASLPIFIPFLGVLGSQKYVPEDAWTEALIGYGGPLLGGIAAWAFLFLGIALGQDWIIAGSVVGFVLNLFNLVPVPPFDGGRICAAISRWFWLVGLALLGAALWFFQSSSAIIIIIVVLIFGFPRLKALFQADDDEQRLYYTVPVLKRLLMAVLYVGLIFFLIFGVILCQKHLTTPPSSSGGGNSGVETGVDSSG